MYFSCPLCSSKTSYSTKEEDIQAIGYRATVHAWGCGTCHWVELLSIEEGKDINKPISPRKEGYGGAARVDIKAFVQKCDTERLTPKTILEIPKWARLLKTTLGEERRVRKMVGLAHHKPVSALELEFANLLARIPNA